MKQPLLLLHGAISSSKQFDDVIQLLEDDFEVHAPDFPGHGGTESPEEQFSIPLFAQSVTEYMKEKNISGASVFGYSMGGYVALYLAATYPSLFYRVFTLATKLAWSQQVAEQETAMLNPEKIEDKIPAFARWLEEMHAPQDWKRVLTKTSEMLLELGKNPLLTQKEFSLISIPVRIGIGELDKMVSTEESTYAASQVKNGELVILPSTPHPFEKVDKQLVAKHIRGFFN